MWRTDGTPTKALEQAICRGIRLDVGHGAASFNRDIAKRVIAAGFRDFSISTDVHTRNAHGVVKGMPDTISKFLALGMTLPEVIRSVTVIPASNLGLNGWCEDIQNRATIFRFRPACTEDSCLLDSFNQIIEYDKRFEPVAVIRNGKIEMLKKWEILQCTIEESSG